MRRPRGFVRRSTDRCCHGPYPHPRFLCVLFHDLAQVGEEFEVAFVLCNLSLGDRRVLEERTRSQSEFQTHAVSCQGLIEILPDLLVMVDRRSEEHTSELQSLMRISYAVFCLKKKTQISYI